MVHLRRTVLVDFAVIVILLVGGGLLIEGVGLAAIAATACVFALAIVIPLIAMFEEEHSLPAEEAARRGLYPRQRER